MALRYEAGKTRAPIVVAKGRDLMAQQINAVAAQHGVPIVENPPAGPHAARQRGTRPRNSLSPVSGSS